MSRKSCKNRSCNYFNFIMDRLKYCLVLNSSVAMIARGIFNYFTQKRRSQRGPDNTMRYSWINNHIQYTKTRNTRDTNQNQNAPESITSAQTFALDCWGHTSSVNFNPFSSQVCFMDCFSCAFQNCFSQLVNSIIAFIKI